MDAVEPLSATDSRDDDHAAVKRAIIDKLVYSVGKDPAHAVPRDWFVALSLAVRDRMVDAWMETTRRVYRTGQKRVYYLSMEFLIGRLLTDSMANLGMTEACRQAMSDIGVDFESVVESEPDPALGNGGLGRLAACFLDSMANLGIAAYGYGIRYEHGLFRQSFDDGNQVEQADDWLTLGNPWEFERPEVAYPIEFGGHIETDKAGTASWISGEQILASAYDMPTAGWGGGHVNTLRLWSARPTNRLDLAEFNRGQYLRAAEQEVLAETLSRVLYPDDTTPEGQELRLKQEYFFTAASLQDLLRRFLQDHGDIDALPGHIAIQLNDTHPAIAVPELIRLLVDIHGLAFERAAEIARGCISYTNHTLLPEALERWPADLLSRVLPRHMQIIERIERQFLDDVAATGAEVDLDELRIIEPDDARNVRMGHLAFVGSHKVNGVSALHTGLMKQTVFRGLHEVFPDRIVNQTNGITPRRWLYECNPGLATLLLDTIGDRWITDLEAIQAIAPFAADAGFRDRFAGIKHANKRALSTTIERLTGHVVAPDAMFDVQIKRIHEYKRQLLSALEAVALYQAIRDNPDADWQPRVKIFAGKAAPGYAMAKLVIKLINDIARAVRDDPVVRDRLQIVFLPNYNVSLAEIIIPAADLSEQISTAGMEASGTGNMKLMLNGALTVGTLDGANVEISDRVGPENIFIFGLTAAEVAEKRAAGYDPRGVVDSTPALKAVIEAIGSGQFSPDEPDRYAPIVDTLLNHDYFMVTADFAAYLATQRRIDADFGDRDDWIRRAVLNTASAGWFSSDRTIRGYARDIWGVGANDA